MFSLVRQIIIILVRHYYSTAPGRQIQRSAGRFPHSAGKAYLESTRGVAWATWGRGPHPPRGPRPHPTNGEGGIPLVHGGSPFKDFKNHIHLPGFFTSTPRPPAPKMVRVKTARSRPRRRELGGRAGPPFGPHAARSPARPPQMSAFRTPRPVFLPV